MKLKKLVKKYNDNNDIRLYYKYGRWETTKKDLLTKKQLKRKVRAFWIGTDQVPFKGEDGTYTSIKMLCVELKGKK